MARTMHTRIRSYSIHAHTVGRLDTVVFFRIHRNRLDRFHTRRCYDEVDSSMFEPFSPGCAGPDCDLRRRPRVGCRLYELPHTINDPLQHARDGKRGARCLQSLQHINPAVRKAAGLDGHRDPEKENVCRVVNASKLHARKKAKTTLMNWRERQRLECRIGTCGGATPDGVQGLGLVAFVCGSTLRWWRSWSTDTNRLCNDLAGRLGLLPRKDVWENHHSNQ